MTPAQVAVNATAIRNLAARLEHLGYTGDSHAEAEHIALNLLADGYRPLTPPPPPTGPGSSDEKRRQIVERTKAELAERKRARATADPHGVLSGQGATS